MRTVDSTTKSEKNKSTNQPVYLYSILDYDGSNDLHFAEWDADIVYNGITYIKFPITHEYVGENTQGEIDTVKIKVSNISRLIQAYLEQYDFRGKKVIITMVWANQLGDTDANIKHAFFIDSYVADENNVEFALSSKFDILDLQLPARKYWRNYCNWKFKSLECGYAGAETTCDKTLQRCRQLVNQVRFGGFPSIPSQRIFVS